MAEAAVGTANARFFCHQCNREVSPNLPEFTCPQCQGGFIEQLAQGTGGDSAEEDDNVVDVESDPAAQFADLWQRTFFRFPPSEDGDRRRNRPRRARTRINIRANQRQGERGETANAVTAAAIDAILQNLLGGLGSPVSRSEDGAGPSTNLVFPLSNFLRLHGSPGDYVWGTEGLDTIITQLLNQIDGAGPAPANSEEIEDLPKISVSQQLVDACTDCAVCQEKLALGEEVRKLPCSHYFHFDCIAPWLRLHDSCPVCRLSLNSNQTRG